MYPYRYVHIYNIYIHIYVCVSRVRTQSDQELVYLAKVGLLLYNNYLKQKNGTFAERMDAELVKTHLLTT